MDFRFSERASTVTEIHEHLRHNMQVKSHQAEGFVFLVSNLVAENPWGCILVHAPDLESLKWPESYSPIKFVSHTRQRGWVWKRKWISSDVKQQILVGLLELERRYFPTSVRLDTIWIVKCWQGSFASIHSCIRSW